MSKKGPYSDAQVTFDLEGDDDIILLETLVQSPVFASLKRVIEHYKKGCLSILLKAEDTHHIFKTQGIIEGLGVVENLPSMLVNRRNALLKRKEEEEKKKESAKQKPWLTK